MSGNAGALLSEAGCTLLVAPVDRAVAEATGAGDILTSLESTDVAKKTGALKRAILAVLSGEEQPRLLFTVLRYCITVDDHTLQVRVCGAPLPHPPARPCFGRRWLTRFLPP